jgi:heme exporter protein A
MVAPLRLEVEELALDRGAARVFSGVSFRAGPGDYVELTGPNGAGKTSLLRALAGLLRPREGSIRISSNLGPLDRDASAVAIHLSGHQDGLKPSLTALSHARFWAGLLGGGDAIAALQRAGLGKLMERPAHTLSAGQKRRLALTRLLIAPRSIWLLDEPAAALDVQGRAWLLGVVGDHLAAGGLVVAAVHEPIGVTPSVRVSLDMTPSAAPA